MQPIVQVRNQEEQKELSLAGSKARMERRDSAPLFCFCKARSPGLIGLTRVSGFFPFVFNRLLNFVYGKAQ